MQCELFHASLNRCFCYYSSNCLHNKGKDISVTGFKIDKYCIVNNRSSFCVGFLCLCFWRILLPFIQLSVSKCELNYDIKSLMIALALVDIKPLKDSSSKEEERKYYYESHTGRVCWALTQQIDWNSLNVQF